LEIVFAEQAPFGTGAVSQGDLNKRAEQAVAALDLTWV
jgi:hypothetical protein